MRRLELPLSFNVRAAFRRVTFPSLTIYKSKLTPRRRRSHDRHLHFLQARGRGPGRADRGGPAERGTLGLVGSRDLGRSLLAAVDQRAVGRGTLCDRGLER